ncbi:hypothetical protein LJR231_005450 [Phyllobacterium sp. LjRoot231]
MCNVDTGLFGGFNKGVPTGGTCDLSSQSIETCLSLLLIGQCATSHIAASPTDPVFLA